MLWLPIFLNYTYKHKSTYWIPCTIPCNYSFNANHRSRLVVIECSSEWLDMSFIMVRKLIWVLLGIGYLGVFRVTYCVIHCVIEETWLLWLWLRHQELSDQTNPIQWIFMILPIFPVLIPKLTFQTIISMHYDSFCHDN